MRAKLPSFGAILSLIVMVAVATLWVQSYQHVELADPSTRNMQDRLARRFTTFYAGRAVFGYTIAEFIDEFDPSNDDRWGGLRRRPYHPWLNPRPVLDVDVNWSAVRRAGLDDTIIRMDERFAEYGMFLAKIARYPGLTVSADAEAMHISTELDSRNAVAIARPRPWEWLRPLDPTEEILQRPLPKSVMVNVLRGGDWLGFALFRISNDCNLPIVIDWTALKSLGMDENTRIATISASRKTGAVLSEILRDSSPTGEVQYQASDGIIRISTRKDFDERELPWRIGTWGGIFILCDIAGLVLWHRISRKRREGRRLFSGREKALALIIVLCATVVVTQHLHDPLEFTAFSRLWSLSRSRGFVRLWISPADPLQPYLQHDGRTVDRADHTLIDRRWLRIEKSGWPLISVQAESPIWLPLLLSCALPLLWLGSVLWRRMCSYGPGRCHRCGYDLRASTGRCPECGTAIQV